MRTSLLLVDRLFFMSFGEAVALGTLIKPSIPQTLTIPHVVTITMITYPHYFPRN